MPKQFDEIIERLSKIETLLQERQPAPLSFDEACSYLHISKPTLYKMTCHSQIRHYKPAGKKIYFTKADLDAYLTRNEVRTR